MLWLNIGITRGTEVGSNNALANLIEKHHTYKCNEKEPEITADRFFRSPASRQTIYEMNL